MFALFITFLIGVSVLATLFVVELVNGKDED